MSTHSAGNRPVSPPPAAPARYRGLAAALAVAVGVTTGCSVVDEFRGRPLCPKPTTTWVAVFLHTESDQAEEPQEIEDLTSSVLPAAVSSCARLDVVAAGANGLTAAQHVATVDFDTNAIDGENPEMRAREVARRRQDFVRNVVGGLRAIPYAPASDPFGGYATAGKLLEGASGPRRLTIYGDQLANRPTGCLLSVRDLARVDEVLAVCSPVIPPLRDVEVEVIGAGYDVDTTVSTATAQGLETLLRTFFSRAGAHMSVYVPLPRRSSGKDS